MVTTVTESDEIYFDLSAYLNMQNSLIGFSENAREIVKLTLQLIQVFVTANGFLYQRQWLILDWDG